MDAAYFLAAPTVVNTPHGWHDRINREGVDMQLSNCAVVALLALGGIAGQARADGPVTASPVVVPQQEPTADENEQTCLDTAREKQSENATLQWPQSGQSDYKSPKKDEKTQYSEYTGYAKPTIVGSYDCSARHNVSKTVTPIKTQGRSRKN